MSPVASRTSGDAGFTLVETVVAFAILSLTVATALQIVGGGSLRAHGTAARAAALAHAQSKLALLEASRLVRAGVTTGRFNNDYTWTLAAQPYPVVLDGALLVPWDVELEVVAAKDPTAKAQLRTILLARPAENSP